MTATVGPGSPEVIALCGLDPHPRPDMLLEFSQGRLQLRDLRPGAPGPLWVDFLAPEHEQRARAGRGLLLAKACGVRKGKPLPRVLDATAGLGRDAWSLAALGCEVTAVERNAVAFALLQDGLNRARQADAPAATRITAIQGDAVAALKARPGHEVVYLDPMFPDIGATALPGKEMQYFQELIDSADDESALLAAALASGARRVVIKRARLAPPLDRARQVDVDFHGKSVRFDVYLP